MTTLIDLIGGPESARGFARVFAQEMQMASGQSAPGMAGPAQADNENVAMQRRQTMEDLKSRKSTDQLTASMTRYSDLLKSQGNSLDKLSQRLDLSSEILDQTAGELRESQMHRLNAAMQINEQIDALQRLDAAMNQLGDKQEADYETIQQLTDQLEEMGIPVDRVTRSVSDLQRVLSEKNDELVGELGEVAAWSRSWRSQMGHALEMFKDRMQDARVGLGLLGAAFYKWQEDFSTSLRTGAPSQMWDALWAGMDPGDLYEIQRLNKRTVVALGGTTRYMEMMTDVQQDMFNITGDTVEAMKVSAELGSTLAQLSGDMDSGAFHEAMQSQIAMAKQLRNAAGFTADEFANLTTELVDDASIRHQLLLYNKQERFQQLQRLQTMTIENQLRGVSVEQTKSLIKANAEMASALPTDRLQKAAKIIGIAGALQVEGAQEFAEKLRQGKIAPEDMQRFGVSVASQLQQATQRGDMATEQYLRTLAAEVPGLLEAGQKQLVEQRNISQEQSDAASSQVNWLTKLVRWGSILYKAAIDNPMVQAFAGGGIMIAAAWNQIRQTQYLKTIAFNTGGLGKLKGIGKFFSKRGILASLGGILGVSTGMSMMGDKENESGGLGRVLSMGASGALMGSWFGPMGALIGGGIGSLAGLGMNLFGGSDGGKQSQIAPAASATSLQQRDAYVGTISEPERKTMEMSTILQDGFVTVRDRLVAIEEVLRDIAETNNSVATATNKQLSTYEMNEREKRDREYNRRNKPNLYDVEPVGVN